MGPRVRRSAGRAALLLGFVCASGCVEPNPEHGGLGSGQVSSGSGTGSATSDTSADTQGDEGMDASADGSSSSATATSMSGSSMSTAGDGDGDGDSSTGTTDDPFTTGSDGAEALWHYNDIDECQVPLWCFNGDQGPFSEVGVQVRAFECFSTGLNPPITVYKFAYVIADASAQLADFDLQLRYYDQGGPGALVNSRTLDASVDGTVGDHGIEVGWEIDSADFCIGFQTAAPNLTGALGLAVDETATVPDVTWFQLNTGDGGACDMAGFEDVIDTQPEPTGNLCFAVSVANESP